jgi:hypothetical protein
MTHEDIAKHARRLQSRSPLFGPLIRLSARRALRKLAEPDAIDALCELVIADPGSPAADIVKEREYQCSSVSRRCVLFLLTDQLQRYFDLDFELQYLRAEYRAGDDSLRRHIGEVIRRAGDARLLAIVHEEREDGLREQAQEPTEREVEIAIDVASRNRQWQGLLKMLLDVPLPACLDIIDRLKESGWRPESEFDAAFFDELLRVRAQIRAVPEKPKPPEVALGSVLGEWIARGRGREFAGRDAEELRRVVRDDAPPEAVSALAALATAGRATAEDVNAAYTHRHWLVRLAALVLCEIAPGFALAGAPADTGGGAMWIEQFAPSLLDAAPYQWRASRVSIEGLEGLQSALARRSDANPERLAWARLLEVLARRRHADTIE